MGSRLLLWGLLGAVAQAPPQPLTLREETCRGCYRSCPISCFVGTCGLSYGASVNRFKTSNSCWTCDQSASVGISRVGDYSICTPEESAATDTYVKKKEPMKPPWGSAVPGDAAAAAQEAAGHATEAVAASQKAAEAAEKAAQAAVADFNDVANKAGTDGDKQEIAEAHRLAETIRSQEAEQASRAAEEARKMAEKQYEDDLEKLRKQELETEHAEDQLGRAEKAAEDARAAAADAAAKAADAAREAAIAGAHAAGEAAKQAAADELAAAARAAQRRAIIAATAAKGAADKAGLAGSLVAPPAQGPLPANPAAPVVLAKTARSPVLAKAPAAPDLSLPGAPADLAATEEVPEPGVPDASGWKDAMPAPGAVAAQLAADSSAAAGEEQGTLSPLLPTLMPLPDGAQDTEAARMANAVVAEQMMNPGDSPQLPALPPAFVGVQGFAKARLLRHR